MQNLTKEKVFSELQLQKIGYDRQLQSVKQIDNEMTNLIKSSFHMKIAIILPEKWTKQCQTRELKSKEEFAKKDNYLKKTGCQYINQSKWVIP